MACPRGLWNHGGWDGGMFWLWSSRDIFLWLVYQNGSFLLKGFWWDLWPPGPAISLSFFSPSSLERLSTIVASLALAVLKFYSGKRVRIFPLLEVRAAEWELSLVVGSKAISSLTDAYISGRYRQGPGVSEVLFNTNSVRKISIYPVNVSRVLCKSEGWDSFAGKIWGRLRVFSLVVSSQETFLAGQIQFSLY